MLSLVDQHQTYQANMTDGMVKLLACELSVGPEAIKQLGVGFWPLEQAWVFPERNAKGEIIGLMKRYMSGKKYMFESSRRGLSYILNPDFKKGKKHGRTLLKDFIRVADAHVKCPICGRPDWCLVSRANPSNPDTVICARAEYKTEESKQIGNAGWLHIQNRSKRESCYSKSRLQSSPHPILVVEGASDVLAAHSVGFVAVGKPSATGGIEEAARLLSGKRVIVIGEHDSGAGEQGMEITFTRLQKFCKQVSKVMPPPGVKDLRSWVRRGVTEEELLTYFNKTADTKTDDNLLEDPSPLGVAKQWLKEKHTNGIYTLFRHHRGEWREYNGVCYRKVEKDILDSRLYHYLEGKYHIETKKGADSAQKMYAPDEFKIRRVKHALLHSSQIHNGSDTDEPFIIDEYTSDIDFNREKHIVFKNGVLNIDTGELKTLSPELYITSTLPFNYDPTADCPRWIVTLRDWWGDDEDSILLLQQWLGYNLIASNRLEALMILFGKSGSGKSTITKILQAMLGVDKCTVLDFKDLSYTFGLESAVNKNAIIFSEDQAVKRTDADVILQMIKRVTGRNSISVRIKYGGTFSTELFARLTYECDTLPRFIDNAQALERRVNMLYFGRSFKDCPNTDLKDQLLEEVPGIINWALEGLRDLIKTGKFVQPKVSDVAKKELKYMTSPMAAMGDQCLDLENPHADTSVTQLYDLHREWFKEQGYSVYNRIWFGRVFKTSFPDLIDCRVSHDSKQYRAYKGVTILPEAAQRYLGEPE